jgi:hypothetical protein
MSQDHRLQHQRFELKYLVNPSIVPQLRDFISGHLELDEYSAGRPGRAYPVHSVYLDSDDLKTHHAYLNADRNRFKLRLRYYDGQPNTPVFFEVKARVNNCIVKRRCGVRRDAVAVLAAGQLPDADHLLSREPRHLTSLQRFNYLMTKIEAKPKAHNTYLREAWVCAHDNAVRVTFDRKIFIEPFFEARPVVEMTRPVQLVRDFVVLELKFTTRFPDWLKEMVRCFHLMQSSCAKYSGGVALLGEHRFHPKRNPELWLKPAPGKPARGGNGAEALAVVEGRNL